MRHRWAQVQPRGTDACPKAELLLGHHMSALERPGHLGKEDGACGPPVFPLPMLEMTASVIHSSGSVVLTGVAGPAALT